MIMGIVNSVVGVLVATGILFILKEILQPSMKQKCGRCLRWQPKPKSDEDGICRYRPYVDTQTHRGEYCSRPPDVFKKKHWWWLK